ncbi:hypothetical protein NA57DRAFT_53317 [Rhizodiscina lignyota]|uniref:Uncharacterized protein n=1 Tax=Rhizodiscina lignyota TaxID=1504668 RepID=A0A9P4IJX1_9PEZI|nr:hypothetical protein NA57DRAFT_53317 [Rhizodiscina lignyota]
MDEARSTGTATSLMSDISNIWRPLATALWNVARRQQRRTWLRGPDGGACAAEPSLYARAISGRTATDETARRLLERMQTRCWQLRASACNRAQRVRFRPLPRLCFDVRWLRWRERANGMVSSDRSLATQVAARPDLRAVETSSRAASARWRWLCSVLSFPISAVDGTVALGGVGSGLRLDGAARRCINLLRTRFEPCRIRNPPALAPGQSRQPHAYCHTTPSSSSFNSPALSPECFLAAQPQMTCCAVRVCCSARTEASRTLASWTGSSNGASVVGIRAVSFFLIHSIQGTDVMKSFDTPLETRSRFSSTGNFLSVRSACRFAGCTHESRNVDAMAVYGAITPPPRPEENSSEEWGGSSKFRTVNRRWRRVTDAMHLRVPDARSVLCEMSSSRRRISRPMTLIRDLLPGKRFGFWSPTTPRSKNCFSFLDVKRLPMCSPQVPVQSVICATSLIRTIPCQGDGGSSRSTPSTFSGPNVYETLKHLQLARTAEGFNCGSGTDLRR